MADLAVRTRRRGADLEGALLQAAWEEVSAVGYANLTMEAVAARAGTSKPVLYRRWPSRAALVLAAVRRRVTSVANDVPNTGDLRADVLDVLRRLRRRFHGIGPDITLGLLSELDDVPPGVFDIVPGVVTTILGHAVERGEVGADRITPRIAALPGDLVRHELLMRRGAVPDEFLAEVVDEIFLPLVTR